jgi:hypothetical protein
MIIGGPLTAMEEKHGKHNRWIDRTHSVRQVAFSHPCRTRLQRDRLWIAPSPRSLIVGLPKFRTRYGTLADYKTIPHIAGLFCFK